MPAQSKRRKTTSSFTSTPFSVLSSSSSSTTKMPNFTLSNQLDSERLISACYSDDFELVRHLIEQEEVNAWVQDESGSTSLHAAAAVGNEEMCTCLLRKGNAVWNIVDNLGHTAGDIAYSYNHDGVYQLLLAEGVRSEMLQSLLQSSSLSFGDTDSINEDQDKDDDDDDDDTSEQQTIQADSGNDEIRKSTASDNTTFLESKLEFVKDSKGQMVALDEEGNGVMMGWEEPIMSRTAEYLCEPFEKRKSNHQAGEDELRILNVGFGLGIIDKYFQEYKPSLHLIIEPHPDVLAYAESIGFTSLPNVQFHRGTWQSYISSLESGQNQYESFDVIYFDTYSEHYRDLHRFFDVLPDLLKGPESRFSFFHGLGATSRFFYDVYTEVSELHLREIGLETKWEEVELKGLDQVWERTGEGKKYWGDVGPYRLPKCKLIEM